MKFAKSIQIHNSSEAPAKDAVKVGIKNASNVGKVSSTQEMVSTNSKNFKNSKIKPTEIPQPDLALKMIDQNKALKEQSDDFISTQKNPNGRPSLIHITSTNQKQEIQSHKITQAVSV